jgi:hypothetical protein
MQVRVFCADGSTANGTITKVVDRSLFAVIPGIPGVTEFRFNLGDWISAKGHMISFELWDQPPLTHASLRLMAATHN